MKNQRMQLLLALVLFVGAGSLVFRYLRNRAPSEPMIYFYDLSAGELFSGAQSAVPPIAGIDGAEEDAVRAVVISRTGSRKAADLEIVYLEKYSPEMKAQFEARKSGQPESEGKSISRAASKGHTFVRRVDKDVWYPMTSAEAERIVSEWNVKGENGEYPLVCTP